MALLESLREDNHTQYLADTKNGRMTEPVRADSLDLDSVLLGRRFSREQGTRADGSVKLSAVDDLTADGTNGCARACGMHQRAFSLLEGGCGQRLQACFGTRAGPLGHVDSFLF